MKISIYTPTHDPKYLLDVWYSIKNQLQIFDEWVIVKPKAVELPPIFSLDQRIKVYDNDEVKNNTFVGALKKFACSKCTGDIFVELDHDDLLMEDCIEEVRKAFEDPEVGFVYSNSANFTKDFQATQMYGSRFGWVHRDYNYKGHILHEHIAFEPTPASVGKIWYCPNHVRAWRREAYEASGGYPEEMRVLDDQDLIARTYLVTKFKRINKCLYLYRITGENTWLKYNKEIQDNVLKIYDKYAYAMVTKWANDKGLPKIDLGGRFNCPQGYKSVDLKGADINCDLNDRWPFADNSVGVIRAHDILEHLKDHVHIMKEAYRVLVPGGYFMIQVPSTDGRGAWQDPTHISYWNQNSFFYYLRQEQAKYIDTPVRFQEMRIRSCNISEWGAKNYICYVIAHLIALKDGMNREPGIIEI